MPKPVYLLVIGTGFTEAWHQLSKDEQNSLWSKVMEIDKRVGASYLDSFDSRWADETTTGFGLIEYPNIDAYQQKVAEVEELNWWRYWTGKTLLGTRTAEPFSLD